ncbi:MAG: LysM peptidoglycan-binding domain-containing protein, partial [bacterium]
LPLLALGCAQRKIVNAAPEATPTPPPASRMAWSDAPLSHYSVRKGDSLWAIASLRSVFGDAWAWPLLYRENRDQIQDPNLIYVRQYLNYARRATEAELKQARKIADATPPYHRKELPVQ